MHVCVCVVGEFGHLVTHCEVPLEQLWRLLKDTSVKVKTNPISFYFIVLPCFLSPTAPPAFTRLFWSMLASF